MASSWQELGPAIRTRILSQLSGSSATPVYLDMAAHDAALPCIIVTNAGEEEDQVFDDDAETTETDVDVSVYSKKADGTAGASHASDVELTKAAIRRWTPTMTNWTASPIRFDGAPISFQPLEDAYQTVLSFSVVTQRK